MIGGGVMVIGEFIHEGPRNDALKALNGDSRIGCGTPKSNQSGCGVMTMSNIFNKANLYWASIRRPSNSLAIERSRLSGAPRRMLNVEQSGSAGAGERERGLGR